MKELDYRFTGDVRPIWSFRPAERSAGELAPRGDGGRFPKLDLHGRGTEASGGQRDRVPNWLHEQRLEAVRDAVLASGAGTVLDLGCGDGELLARLAIEPQIGRIVGIDICLDALWRSSRRLEALADRAAAPVDLVHGSMTEVGAMLTGFDCAILVETIEHIEPERLSVLERSVFGAMRPATVVITTPNADFNPLLGVPSYRLRHPDHRFEWGRAKFRRWAQGVSHRNGYGVACSDVAGHHPLLGGASQMACFRRPEQPAVVNPRFVDSA